MDSIPTDLFWKNQSSHENESEVSGILQNSTSHPDTSNATLPIVTLPIGFLSVIFSVRVIWSILAIGGNGLTIFAIVKFSFLQSSTNYLLASLAVADLISGLLTPGVILHHMLVNRPSFVPVCLVEKTFSAISIRGNILCTFWITIDRFFYIAYPLRYPLWMTDIKAFILIGFTWGYILVETSLMMYFTGNVEIGGICKVATIFPYRIYHGYFFPQMLICFLVMILCYIGIGMITYKHNRAIAALHQPFETLENSIFQKQKKIAKMFCIVLVTYFLSYVPQYGLSVLIQKKATVLSLGMEKITTVIFYANSFLNPFIYAWKSKDFKKAFKKIFGINNAIAPPYMNPPPPPPP